METPETEYGLVNVDDLVRAKDHEEAFPYTDTTDCEGTIESYKKLKRIFPVVYILLKMEDKEVKAVIDGWKFVLFARAAGLKEIYACRLNVKPGDELVAAMVQLARTNHNSSMAIYWLIQKLWDKHYLGQGFRSDTTEEELDVPILVADGRRLNIYERIGLELNLTGNKVKQIRKAGMVNPLHLERVDLGKFSISQAYIKCLEEEKGIMPDVPSVKAPTYHTTATPTPVFAEPTTTADYTDNGEVETDTNDKQQPSSEKIDEASATAITVIEVRCPHCNELFKITHKNNSK